MKRVQAGDEVVLSANAYNAWCDAAEDLQRRRMSQSAVSQAERRDADIVLVRNDSGADIGRFGVLGIDGPIISPEDNPDEFKRRVTISGVVPTSTHSDSFVVLLEPLAAGQIGEAIISGVCQVQVNVVSSSATTCGAVAGDLEKLTTGKGSTPIIWKESGTGTKWAIVRIGGCIGLKVATLLGSLSYRSTANATVTKGGSGTVVAHDVLLKSGESLDSGTVVILANIGGDECVIDASCA